TVQKQARGYVRVRSGKLEGWVDAHDLVLVDKAIPYFTDRIRSSSKDAEAYQFRAAVWAEKKEYDKAIADYNQAIRIDPTFAAGYFNRGLTWADEKEYDKAIADYNQAIRIDPTFAAAYYSRR